MKHLTGTVLVAVVACAAMIVGCRDTGKTSESGAARNAGASSSIEADRAEGSIAYKVSGMKKTASGAT